MGHVDHCHSEGAQDRGEGAHVKSVADTPLADQGPGEEQLGES